MDFFKEDFLANYIHLMILFYTINRINKYNRNAFRRPIQLASAYGYHQKLQRCSHLDEGLHTKDHSLTKPFPNSFELFNKIS